ncbi:MAG: hypothetical protein H0T46_26470 [Deltaproteobacteria bacterium]|nr:hypothetical protein [Deltaproteobacteria bacterium]
MSAHPRTQQTRPLPALRILAYAPGSKREEWILSDLRKVAAIVQVARSPTDVIAALTEDPPPVPAVLVLDFDHMPAAEMLLIHTIRERGWCGEIVAVGAIAMAMRNSLGIERVVSATAPPGALTNEINSVGFHAKTTQIPLAKLNAREG